MIELPLQKLGIYQNEQEEYLISKGWWKASDDLFYNKNSRYGFCKERATSFQEYLENKEKRKKYHEENCKPFKIFKFLNPCFDSCKKCNNYEDF